MLKDGFCVVPFTHLSTSPQGGLRPCCFSSENIIKDENEVPFNLGENSLSSIWNSKHYNQLRKDFIEGKKPRECSYCFDEESMGKKSKRIKENEKEKDFIEVLVNEFQENGGRLDSLPKTIDLRLGNLCNLKCLSCNPLFSSGIEKEMKELWPEDFFHKVEYKNLDYNNDWYQSATYRENIDQMIHALTSIYISGGEPIINPAMEEALKLAISKGRAINQCLRFNTNLHSLKPSFYKLLSNFKKVEVSVSLDAIGKELEVIRYPSNFNQIHENLEKLLKTEGNIHIDINCTVSLLNILIIEPLYKYIKDLEKKYNRQIHIGIDLVHAPSYLAVWNLSPSHKDRAREMIGNIKSNFNLTKNEEMELDALKLCLSKKNQEEAEVERLNDYIDLLERIRGVNIREFLAPLN